MLTQRIRIQVIAFVIISLAVTTYLGARYVGINLTGSGYDVTVELPDAGGAFENAEVTYRGVPVGRVKELTATASGADLRVHIDGDAPAIPADASVRVVNRSAIGEQFLDLRPDSSDGPQLKAGDTIRGGASSLPPTVDRVIRSASSFVASVPEDALRTVIDESYEASRGAGGAFGQLIDTSREYARLADKNLLVTVGLIESSQRVLATQQASSASILGYSRDLALIARTLHDSDGDLRRLIGVAPAAAQEIDRLFTEVGVPLGILMSNLVSTAEVFGTNAAGLEDAMIRMPQAMSVGWAITNSQGASFGLAQNYFDPLPCTTGYAATQRRPGLDTGPGRPFNLRAGCTLSPSTGVNVRGPQSVLRRPAARTTPRVTSADSLADLYGGGR
ncbi:MCE family protein [Nocardioides marmoriginsengisoli]|uniref:MCE family protein n=1 Tax=Nocardioides marmoriginsengisoli TaxID=661483 RepID=A0A3N0CPL3_9ACTN|nr:MlaD family protein [Nocardioides marmoriginsengisoli]RNL64833.1 MCE family protein [Nocardioides marmoriginsengisoli]